VILKKLAHAIWQCKYHVVWCPKYRFKILKGALQKSVKEIISQLCEWKKISAWNNSNSVSKYYPFRVTFYSTPFRGGC